MLNYCFITTAVVAAANEESMPLSLVQHGSFEAISGFEPVALLITICSPSWIMQEYASWSIKVVRLDPRWSDRVHNIPCVRQPHIVEWLKLIQHQCSVITELPVSSPWSFRLNQSQSLIRLWHCTQGQTKRDRNYRGEDRRSRVFTPAFQFH